MNKFMLVAGKDNQLSGKLRNKMMVVKTDEIGEAASLFSEWHEENDVFCIAVYENRALSAIDLGKELLSIPIVLHVPEAGSIKKMIGRADKIVKSSMKIFFPADKAENIINIQILSSLGVCCGLNIEEGRAPVIWELVNNLMHYSVYSRAGHAPVEPFNYTTTHFKQGEHSYFRTPYFDNPHKFLHIDNEENIALSAGDLTEGRFVAHGLEALDSITENTEYQKRLSDWQNYFLEYKRCAYCPAWRICHGDYHKSCEGSDQPYSFFKDLLEAAVNNSSKRIEKIWQF